MLILAVVVLERPRPSLPATRIGPDGGRLLLISSPSVAPFYLGEMEVSESQFQRFQPDPRRGSNPNLPAVGVSWAEARSYCDRTGLRLPSVQEWKAAAGADDGRRYPWGNERHGLEQPVLSLGGRPRALGLRRDEASPFGCLDMVGKAREWTSDWGPPDDPRVPYMCGRPVAFLGGTFGDDNASLEEGWMARGEGEPDMGFRCAADAETAHP